MTIQKDSQVTLTIEKLAFGGEGIGYVGNQFVVFVPGAIPGDVVKARITKKKKRFAYAQIDEFLIKSEDRIEPRCKHFDTCGGCKLQYLPYEKQLEHKEAQVQEAFVHLGKIPEPPMKKIIGCDNPWFYRNKMEFSFGFENNEIRLGLHPPKMRYEVFQLEECHLQEPYIADYVGKIRNFAVQENLSIYHPNPNEGLLKTVFFRTGKHTGELMINLVINVPYEIAEESITDYFPTEKFIDTLTQTIKPTSIYLTLFASQKGNRTKQAPVHIYGNKTITDTLSISKDKELKFNISPYSFFQPNTDQAQKLYKEAVSLIGKQKKAIFDLYCGTGTIGLMASEQAEKIIGIDIQESSIENARKNAHQNDIENASFIQGDVLEKLNEYLVNNPDHSFKNTCAILDPPRAGLAQKFTEKLIDLNIPELIYISCNPATMARDTDFLMQGGYKLKLIQPMDMLPHTDHIECIAHFIK